MTESLFLRPLNLSWLAILAISIFLLFSAPAIVVVPVLMLAPFVIRQDNYKDKCYDKSTQAACDFYRATGSVCSGLKETFEADVEWKMYRNAVCRGFINASDRRLLQSYSEEMFPDCDVETTAIQDEIERFSKEDCTDDKAFTSEEKRVDTMGMFANPFFLGLGALGAFFSIGFAASGVGGEELPSGSDIVP